MKEGLYKATYETPIGAGSAVVYIADGKIRGGDSALYYVGTYKSAGEHMTATLRTDRHSSVPGMTSVFGVDRATVALSGSVHGDTITCRGEAREAPGVTFKATLKLLSD